MPNATKTILIVTANDPDDRLALLAEESKNIQYTLNNVPNKDFNLVWVHEATTADIIRELNVSNRIVEVLHYAGHANGRALRLNDQSADAQALAAKLQSLKSLKLVFINGCASRGQVAAFHGAGIPFVIATARSVGDHLAAWFAGQFYEAMGKGKSVSDAFHQVVLDANLQQKKLPLRSERGGLRIPEDGDESLDLAWDLYIREGAENEVYVLPLTDKKAVNTEGGIKKNVLEGNTITGNVTVGDVYHNYGDIKIPRALTKQPFLSEVFLGRADDLKAIKNQLFHGNNMLLLVNGQGGVGKTSIAAQYYVQNQDLYAHTAWVLSEANIANALVSNLAVPLGLTFAPTATQAQQLDILLRGLANLDKPCLLVIDNANELEDLERNYLLLSRCANFHLLLTSRITEFEQAATHLIEGLGQADALDLFRRYYPKMQAAEVPIFNQIHAAVGGNTLVVEVLAKNLALFHGIRQQYSLAQLLADLQTQGLLALSKSQGVKTRYQAKDALRKETPETIIAAMYDLGELSRPQVALLSVFAVLPAESIGFDTLETLLPDRADDLEQTLLDLAQRGWIEHDKPTSTFKCNPVIQEITKKKNDLLRGDCATLIDSLNEQLDLNKLHEDNYKYSTVFVRFAETVVAAFNAPDYNIALLSERIGTYHIEIGNLGKAISFYLNENELCKQLLQANPDDSYVKELLAISYSKLGDTHAALGNLDKALEFYEDDADLIKQLYDSYPTNAAFENCLAISYEKLGNTYAALGNLDKALAFYKQRYELGKQLYDSYPTNVEFKNSLAISYFKLGQAHAALGNLDKALAFYENDADLMEQLYDSYPMNVAFKNGLAISYEKLGQTHATLGNLDKALAFYKQRYELGKQLYDSYPTNVEFKNGLAISYEKLGEIHSALGNLDKALAFYEDFANLMKQLYDSYPTNVSYKNGLAVSYAKLGVFNRDALKDNRKARFYFEKAQTLWLDLVRDAPQYVQFQKFLGIVQDILKDL